MEVEVVLTSCLCWCGAILQYSDVIIVDLSQYSSTPTKRFLS